MREIELHFDRLDAEDTVVFDRAVVTLIHDLAGGSTPMLAGVEYFEGAWILLAIGDNGLLPLACTRTERACMAVADVISGAVTEAGGMNLQIEKPFG